MKTLLINFVHLNPSLLWKRGWIIGYLTNLIFYLQKRIWINFDKIVWPTKLNWVNSAILLLSIKDWSLPIFNNDGDLSDHTLHEQLMRNLLCKYIIRILPFFNCTRNTWSYNAVKFFWRCTTFFSTITEIIFSHAWHNDLYLN